MSVGGIGRASGEAVGGELELELGALSWETLGALEHDRMDGEPSVTAEALARLQGTPRTVDDALAAPSMEHVARALAAEQATAALARMVRRGARRGEPGAQQRMRALVARLLQLRDEAAAGRGKVSVG